MQMGVDCYSTPTTATPLCTTALCRPASCPLGTYPASATPAHAPHAAATYGDASLQAVKAGLRLTMTQALDAIMANYEDSLSDGAGSEAWLVCWAALLSVERSWLP